MPSTLTRTLADDAATAALGAAIAPLLVAGLSIHLSGPLGAGKTTLVRALLRALGERGRVRSPTFTLVEPYRAAGLDLAHLDLYRFEHATEWIDAGFDELLGGDTVTLIEWPERAASLLPAPDLLVELQIAGESRRATLAACSPRGATLLSALTDRLQGMPPDTPAAQEAPAAPPVRDTGTGSPR